jgi:MFS family permease
MSEDSATPQRHASLRWAGYLVEEIGLVALFTSARDTKILCLQRFVRLFAYGASTLILATYLAELGISDGFIGLFMTLTLAGDVVISFFLTLIADNLGRRKILALGALLMGASGVVFALTGNYWALLAAAVLGVITPR